MVKLFSAVSAFLQRQRGTIFQQSSSSNVSISLQSSLWKGSIRKTLGPLYIIGNVASGKLYQNSWLKISQLSFFTIFPLILLDELLFILLSVNITSVKSEVLSSCPTVWLNDCNIHSLNSVLNYCITKWLHHYLLINLSIQII